FTADGGFCPSDRTLVMIHGIFSSPQDAFGALAAPKAFHDPNTNPAGPYVTVVGIEYDFTAFILPDLANGVADVLNQIFDGSCTASAEFDIEAHSKGTLVALAALDHMTPTTISKLKHIVLVGGPLDGTPAAISLGEVASYYVNQVSRIP